MDYIVLMDISGDITGFEYTSEELGFIPMEYSVNDVMQLQTAMKKREELKEFYNSQRNGELTKTSQISPYLYYGYFEPYLAAGKSIIYLCLSSGLSSTYQSAEVAKDNLKEKYPDQQICVIDTKGCSGGCGILAETAIKNIRSGVSFEDTCNQLSALVNKIKYWFLVQNLDYLKRGGRISATTATVGSLLNIHPILEITEDGKLENLTNKRGLKASIKEVVRLFTTNYDPSTNYPIYIIDSDDEELNNTLKSEVLGLYPNADVRQVELTPVIGAHTGPGLGAIICVCK